MIIIKQQQTENVAPAPIICTTWTSVASQVRKLVQKVYSHVSKYLKTQGLKQSLTPKSTVLFTVEVPINTGVYINIDIGKGVWSRLCIIEVSEFSLCLHWTNHRFFNCFIIPHTVSYVVSSAEMPVKPLPDIYSITVSSVKTSLVIPPPTQYEEPVKVISSSWCHFCVLFHSLVSVFPKTLSFVFVYTCVSFC